MNPELSAVLSFLLRPSHGLLLTMLAGWLIWRFGGYRAGKRIGQIAAIGLALIVLTPIPYLAIKPLEDRFKAPEPPDAIAGIILLTGGEQAALSDQRGDTLYNTAGERVMLAAKLAHLYPQATILVTGGGSYDLAQADISAKFLRSVGIDGQRILIERTSRNTRENATNGFQVARPTSGKEWVLVTSAYHMPRSVGVFREAGWTVIPWPTDYRSASNVSDMFPSLPIVTTAAETFDVAFHEWAGLVIYRLSGWTGDLFPAPTPASQ